MSEVWRHYKDGLCEVLHGNVHTETGETLIVYRHGDRRVWACPVEIFHSTVEVDGEVRLRFEREQNMPEEKIREHVKCAHEGCKSIFWRPQEAEIALSTADLAQLHGWTLLDREKGLLHCAWGHQD